jgi:endonuclease YncB( thermonuclease family)
MDGDTIEVLHNQRPEHIRLSGIDCPEKGQAYGTRAKQAASDLAFGKQVTVQTHGHDKYKRTIGDVILEDGTNVNHMRSKMAGASGIGSMRRGILRWQYCVCVA